MRYLRLSLAALAAAVVTFGLFLFMYRLISSGGDERAELEAIAGIHFGKVEIPDEIQTRSRRKPLRPPPSSQRTTPSFGTPT